VSGTKVESSGQMAPRDILAAAASIAAECMALSLQCDKHGPEFVRLARGLMQVWMAVRLDTLATNIGLEYPMGTEFLMKGGKERSPAKKLTVKKTPASAFGGDQ